MPHTLAVLGAASKLGQEVVAAALARGHLVRALVRREGHPSRGETLVVGDALDPAAVRALVREATVVVSLVGPGPGSPLDLSTRFTRVLLDAMAAEGVDRLVYLTGVMVGHPLALRGLVYRLLPRTFSATLRAQIADRTQAERMVMLSPLCWTVVRPPRLIDGAPHGGVEWSETLRVGSFASIHRSDLANFILDRAITPDLVGYAVAVVGR